jgi:hypothetical protein
MIKCGEFSIDVFGPYPCSLRLYYGNDRENVIHFGHKELTDIKYVIDKAMQECYLRLKGTNFQDEVFIKCANE